MKCYLLSLASFSLSHIVVIMQFGIDLFRLAIDYYRKWINLDENHINKNRTIEPVMFDIIY